MNQIPVTYFNQTVSSTVWYHASEVTNLDGTPYMTKIGEGVLPDGTRYETWQEQSPEAALYKALKAIVEEDAVRGALLAFKPGALKAALVALAEWEGLR